MNDKLPAVCDHLDRQGRRPPSRPSSPVWTQIWSNNPNERSTAKLPTHRLRGIFLNRQGHHPPGRSRPNKTTIGPKADQPDILTKSRLTPQPTQQE